MTENKKRSSKNLKVNTRIVITAVLAILIPLIIIASFSTVLVMSVSSYFNFSSVTTNSYSTINQMQWSQTLSAITGELVSDVPEQEKIGLVKDFVAPLEKINSQIYIEKNGVFFYSTDGTKSVLDAANKVVAVDKDRNINYFGENGLVIVTHAVRADESYLVVIVNGDYTVNDASQRLTAKEFTNLLLGRTGIVVLVIVLLFIASIVIISFITSQTIVRPIKKIANGADEIARGNLNYEIDYKSTNELGQTVDSFNDMRLRLKDSIDKQNKSIEERNELIAGIAHDVRTPLTSAKGYAEGLRDGIASTPEKQKKYLDTIISSINNTEKILNDLLTISRFELKSFKLNMVDVAVNDFFNDGVEEIKLELDREGFDFVYSYNCSPSTVISLDTDAFARVISNIIRNSVRYSRDDVKGRIELVVNEYDKTILIEISDNGIGVERKNLAKIFDAMYRADPARTKTSQGSGLGLAICKQIVERHNGIIWASDNHGEGLSIFISLHKKELTQ